MLTNSVTRLSKRLILSYAFDWVVILAIAVVGGLFDKITPYKRPFSLVDLAISFPYEEASTVPFWLDIVVAFAVPGVVVAIISLVFVPGPTASKQTPRSLVWRRKLWEWNTAWMGLGLSVASALLLTQGLKNLSGKARPDLLARCNPDVANFEKYVVGGGYGQTVDVRWVRVSADICLNPDESEVNDGFRSWPSGHASFAWSGLLYFTLFLCSKFAITIPFLSPRPYSQDARYTAIEEQELSVLPLHKERPESHEADTLALNTNAAGSSDIVPIRNQAAAPPNYLLVIAFIPIAAASYISLSRYTDFKHHGIDILSGSLIGIFTSWFSFRWYHLPIRTGAGWAWGARSRDRAFGIGLGVSSYVGQEGWISKKTRNTTATTADPETSAP